MQFSEILGQEHIKSHLTKSADSGRIPHAQLFVGPEGSGTLPMALAYAQYVLCKNSGGENSGENEACNLKFGNISHPDLHFITQRFPLKMSRQNQKALISLATGVRFWPHGVMRPIVAVAAVAEPIAGSGGARACKPSPTALGSSKIMETARSVMLCGRIV